LIALPFVTEVGCGIFIGRANEQPTNALLIIAAAIYLSYLGEEVYDEFYRSPHWLDTKNQGQN
jgi:hypothetical protein